MFSGCEGASTSAPWESVAQPMDFNGCLKEFLAKPMQFNGFLKEVLAKPMEFNGILEEFLAQIFISMEA